MNAYTDLKPIPKRPIWSGSSSLVERLMPQIPRTSASVNGRPSWFGPRADRFEVETHSGRPGVLSVLQQLEHETACVRHRGRPACSPIFPTSSPYGVRAPRGSGRSQSPSSTSRTPTAIRSPTISASRRRSISALRLAARRSAFAFGGFHAEDLRVGVRAEHRVQLGKQAPVVKVQ